MFCILGQTNPSCVVYIMQKPDSIIAQLHSKTLNGQPAQLVQLHNGLIIALSATSLGCYKNFESVFDELGNGLVSFVQLDEQHNIAFKQDLCVSTHAGGYIGLVDGKALLITPFKATLYLNNHDGLRGLNPLAELDLPQIDVH